MSELVQTLAYVFRRRGVTSMKKLEFRGALAHDLRWLLVPETKRLVEHAVALGLLADEGEDVRATFDVAAVEIPVGFRATPAILDERPRQMPPPARSASPALPPPAPSPATTWEDSLLAAAQAQGLSREALDKEAADERARRADLLTPGVARLLVARRHGVDVAPFLPKAYETLKK